MRKCPITFLVVLFAQILVCFGQDPQAPESQAEAPAKSIVRGRVIYEGTSQPVRRGLIGLLETGQYLQTRAGKVSFVNEKMDPERFVLTDDNGEFEMREVKPGSYYPFVQVRNVLNPQSINSFYGDTSSISVNKLDFFFKKIYVDGISEIHVLVPVKRGGAISGSVSYADGTPAIGVRVKILRKGSEIAEDEFVSVGETETDDRGHYRRIEMIPGSYFVELSEPSDHSARNLGFDDWRDFTREAELITYFPGVAERKRAEEINLDWGQEAANIDVQIPQRKLYKISGQVIAKDTQKPFDKVNITFERVGAEGPQFYGSNDRNAARSDETGFWSFKDLPAGKYRIRISPPRRFFESETTHESHYSEVIKILEIVDTDISKVLAELPLESALSGTISLDDEDVRPTLVRFDLVDRERKVISTKEIKIGRPQEGAQITETQIRFRMGLLSAGKYTIRAEVSGDENYVKSIRIKGLDVIKSSFTIKESEEITDVKVVISGGMGTLTGVAYDAKGKPAPMTIVLLVPTDQGTEKGQNFSHSGWTNSAGEFRVKLAPGEYFVVAGGQKRVTVKTTDEWIKDIAKTGERVRIKPDETTKTSLTVLSQ